MLQGLFVAVGELKIKSSLLFVCLEIRQSSCQDWDLTNLHYHTWGYITNRITPLTNPLSTSITKNKYKHLLTLDRVYHYELHESKRL